MRTPTAEQLLNVWERGVDGNAVQRALLLLSAAYPELSLETLSTLTIGQRDACLLLLRERVFGSHLNGVSTCPQCRENLDLDFNIHDICAFPLPEVAATLSAEVDGCEITFHLPNSIDLAAISVYQNVDEARKMLLQRCVDSVICGGDLQEMGDLSESARLAIADKMATADPYANIQLQVTCPNCGHQWMAGFDIESFLWKELHVWAQRILREVHTLASAYGWNEAEVLSLTPRRRQFYIDLVQQ